MAGLFAAASKAASAASAAVVPQPSFSLADVVAELRELRSHNALLAKEKLLLESQVALLSQQLCLEPSKRTVKEALPPVSCSSSGISSGSSPSQEPSGPSDSAMENRDSLDAPRSVSAFSGLRAELATNLGVDPEAARAAQDGALAEQLARARLQADGEAAARQAISCCLAAELKVLEEVNDMGRLEALVLLEGVRARCGELEHQLHLQAADAQRTSMAAVAAARMQAHQQVAELEEALGIAQEELARKDAALDSGLYEAGTEEELEAERRRRAEWMAKCEVLQATVSKLQSDVSAMRESHEPELKQAHRRLEEAEKLRTKIEARLRTAEATRVQAERQVEKLSADFNLQTGELEAAIARARRAEEKLSKHCVEKSTARQWIVNFVENESGRYELLKLMASWWEFSEEDSMRVGIRDRGTAGEGGVAPFGDPSDGSLLNAFEAFLINESAQR
eukprot:scaffold236865_cov27-Tisochrysis_lutea.AAC.1